MIIKHLSFVFTAEPYPRFLRIAFSPTLNRTLRNKEYAEKPVAYPKSFSAYSLIGDPQWPFAVKAFRKLRLRPSCEGYLSHRSLRQLQ